MTGFLTETADALIAVDAAGMIIEANRSAERLLGPVVGESVIENLCPQLLTGLPACLEGWPPRVARLPGTQELREQEVLVQSSRGPLEVSVTVRFLRDERRRLTGAVFSLRDLAPRRRVEQSSVELVSTVSHELRSPLASVKGYTATLLHRWDRFSDDDKRFMIEQVNHDADRVTRLITELLDISRLESGRLKLRPEWIRIPDIVERIVDKLRFDHPDATVAVRFTDSFPPVYADRDKVEQVLTNLIENAAKYGDPTTVEVEGRVDDGAVAVSVSDRGEGLPAELLPRLFSKFYRAENRAGRPTGTGLGLYIARGLAEAHGGKLEANSVLGEGSVFTLTLPLRTSP